MKYARDASANVHPTTEMIVARQQIQDLLVLYNLARDDKDLDGLVSLFAEDGTFATGDVEVNGRQQLREFYLGTMTKYHTTNHVTHLPYLEIHSSDRARGIVPGSAELVLRGELYLTSYRYSDEYTQIDGSWYFARRLLRFSYLAPFSSLATTFRDDLRVCWPGQAPLPFEIPELVG